MSTTVHYFGKIKTPDMIRELKDEFQEIAQVSGWTFEKVDHVFSPTESLVPARLTLKGIRLILGKSLSPVQLTFDKDGYLSHIYYETVMTENPLRVGVEKTTQVLHQVHTSTALKGSDADPQGHIRLIKLLDYVKKKYVPNLEVIDNTGYWYSRDESVLKTKSLQLLPK